MPSAKGIFLFFSTIFTITRAMYCSVVITKLTAKDMDQTIDSLDAVSNVSLAAL